MNRIEEVTKYIDEKKRLGESLQRIVEIQQSINDSSVETLRIENKLEILLKTISIFVRFLYVGVP